MKAEPSCGRGATVRLSRAVRGFTLIELLVVIVIVAVLSGMLLPALSKARSRGHSAACLGNGRQLQLAWQLYADDHGDVMVANRSSQSGGEDVSLPGSWVLGNERQSTSAGNITNGTLFPYLRSLSVYRCPADRSRVLKPPRVPRLRSYTLSGFLNGSSNGLPSFTQRLKTHAPQISEPTRVFTFVDTSDSAITSGNFGVFPPGTPGLDRMWNDIPGDRHDRGAVFAWVDGRVERRAWRAPLPKEVNTTADGQNLVDLRWLQARIPDP